MTRVQEKQIENKLIRSHTHKIKPYEPGAVLVLPLINAVAGARRRHATRWSHWPAATLA